MLLGLKNLLFGGAKASKVQAKNRLHFVLVQDRAGLSQDELAKFKREMIDVLEKYFVIDEQGFDISYKRSSDSTTLLINSPIIVRRQDAPGHVAGSRAKAKTMRAEQAVP